MKLRKKQLYAILLAGTLAAGAVPSAVWAAEDAAAVSETSESSADTPAGEEAGAGGSRGLSASMEPSCSSTIL